MQITSWSLCCAAHWGSFLNLLIVWRKKCGSLIYVNSGYVASKIRNENKLWKDRPRQLVIAKAKFEIEMCMSVASAGNAEHIKIYDSRSAYLPIFRFMPGVKRNFWACQAFRMTGQAKFLTSAAFLIYNCMSVISLLRAKEQTYLA